ncbi:MAG: type II toxin-antitoxin system prevent-host-death family antitoxin [Rhodocyclaceae bacterium]|nr:MAG: type II toxin-antitoxin system prevent-host-death family antitoxin [Rhodocyclaceae bacterium]
MDVSIKDLKAHLAHYLRLAGAGESIVVTSHKKPLVWLAPLEVPPAGLPAVAGVRWGNPSAVYAGRRLADLPRNKGEPLSDWIVENRR